ncbi:porin [Paraburkholderia steynii]|uniref:Porin n=1 Tax=Paraburkholderia steynii TaxID=1245441 RepID=A0A4R0XFD5_9BURK|nr:porin [Paraburkholderia steynii]
MLQEVRYKWRLVVYMTGLLIACPTRAQSSITLYGALDGAMLYTSKTLDTNTGGNAGKRVSMISNGSIYSRLGMIGTEDLGGGLKAKFKLESGFYINDGTPACNGNYFGCEAWVSLDSNYGEVKAGLQFSPFIIALYMTDPRSLSFFGSGNVIFIDHFAGTSFFSPNSLSYTSPDVSGFQARLLYSFGGSPGDFRAGQQYSASIQYQHGPLLVNAAIYDSTGGSPVQTPIPTNLSAVGRTVGASVNFGAVTIKASFVNYKVAGSFNSNVFGGGFSWVPTPYLNFDGGVWLTSDRNRTANHSLLAALGGAYNLSKRTAVYAQIASASNHGAMNTGVSVIGGLFGTSGSTVGATVGLRHLF